MYTTQLQKTKLQEIFCLQSQIREVDIIDNIIWLTVTIHQ